MNEVLLIPVLLVVNAVLVAAEIAIVASRRVRLEQSEARGELGARGALDLISHPTRYISTIQLGITVITLSLGALGEASLADHFEAWLKRTIPALEAYASVISMAVVVVGMTLAVLWLSEILPKRLAMANPERTARMLGTPVRWLAWLAAPLVFFLTKATELVLKGLGVSTSAKEDINEDEIRGLIEKGTQSGIFEQKEGEIVDRVFRLADRKVKGLMIPRSDISWIDASETVERVRLIVATSPHSHFPVCRGGLDDIVGIVHVKDLVKYGLVSGGELSLEALAVPPLFVPENTLALKLLDRFKETRQHLALVVDEFGGTEGLVTLNDLVEAIVGDVVRGESSTEIVRRADGSYLVDARAPIAELTHALEMAEFNAHDQGFSDTDVQTVAGLVLALLGHVPQTGEIAEGFGLRFEVVDMDHQRIDKVLVSKRRELPEQPTGEAGHVS
ncbi:MAG: hemolysin family protein [Phycisphaerales bacterium]|nr:hemolysin family protein [Phycisphaerales bacterium]